MKYLCLLLVTCVAAQPQLRVTAQTLSKATSNTVFPPLPKGIQAAAVQVCNQSGEAANVPQAHILQELRALHGFTILPKDVAMALTLSAQSKSKWNTTFRYLNAATGTVGSLATLRVIEPNSTWGAWIVAVTAILGVAGANLNQAVTPNMLLTISGVYLPDPIQLQGNGCVSGITLVEADGQAHTIDVKIELAASSH